MSAETHIADAAIRQLYGQFHDVTTRGIFHARVRVRVFKFADIARILEMVEDFGGVEHALTYNGNDDRKVLPGANRQQIG